MSFAALKFTTAGKILQARALAGEELKFTQIKMGNGELGSTAPAALTDLVNELVALDLTAVERHEATLMVKAGFSNMDLTEGFYWREIGLMAADPDYPTDRTKDILYCYQNAGELAEYIQSTELGVIEKIISISAVVGDAENVTAEVGSVAFVDAERFAAHVADEDAHPALQAAIKAMEEALGEVKTDFTAHVADEEKHITAAERESWNGKLSADQRGVAGGVASLDESGKIPEEQLPEVSSVTIRRW